MAMHGPASLDPAAVTTTLSTGQRRRALEASSSKAASVSGGRMTCSFSASLSNAANGTANGGQLQRRQGQPGVSFWFWR